MKKQPLVSLIVPIYNAEKFLDDCINSILKQTYTEIEIILVNDGSTDFSGELCDKYLLQDTRIKVIHLKNGGVSRARNEGISICNGEYISFIDSDDTIEPDYIKNFICSIEDGIYIYTQETKIIKHDNSIDTISYKAIGTTGINEIFNVNNLCGHGYAACKLYKTSLIKGNKIKFKEEIKFSEDLLFILECLLYTNKIKYIDKAGYNYFLRTGNASSKEYPLDTELMCWKYFYSLIRDISVKNGIELFQYKGVGEIYNMLFSRIRNSLYHGNYNKKYRTSIFKSMSKDEIHYLYKYCYKSNLIVRLGYSIRKFLGISCMDAYFNLIYKINK